MTRIYSHSGGHPTPIPSHQNHPHRLKNEPSPTDKQSPLPPLTLKNEAIQYPETVTGMYLRFTHKIRLEKEPRKSTKT